ncbi:M10 family metallopeptidase domain-containing protein [Plantactinospora solaniradicis]|uniref:M10 family metallopeptidase domain-containing protein n=1 Tax=Plantactinospora solaniradicis TaxID=1723736 RepID=A0ABW1K964_9ACTN
MAAAGALTLLIASPSTANATAEEPGPAAPAATSKPTPLRYDHLPPASAGAPRFVLDAGTWLPDRTLTYRFANSTPDVGGFDQRSAIRLALDLWATETNLSFSEVTTGGQLVFSFVTDDHSDGFPFDNRNGVLAHGFFPPPTNTTSIAGDVHFDDDETWSALSQSSSAQPIDLRTVAAHEIGHALGLRHSADRNALMFDFYNGSHRFLSADDIAGIQAKYGE